jgi:mono/diheme cytochrome c family protein
MRNRALVVALLAGIPLGACRPSDARETRDFERMRRQQKYGAFDTSAFFANGSAMQAPPAHTVPSDTSVEQLMADDGARQFAISCAPCHGSDGFGGGTIAPNLVAKRPPSLRTPAIAALTGATIDSVITFGFGRMPPLGWQMNAQMRTVVAGYVRTLATRPIGVASRNDSSTAARLRTLDSMVAAGASVAALVRARKEAP